MLTKQLRAEAAQHAAALTARGHQLGLAVILVGEDPASQVYVRSRVKACEDNGFLSSFDRYLADLPETDLLDRIDALNRDPCIHGILVQLLLPKHIGNHEVPEVITPEEDADGLRMVDAGALMTDAPLFRPCTPYGCVRILESINYPMYGVSAVVIGASNITGKPIATLLLQASVTITIYSSKTRDLAAHTREADIIVAAAGRRNVITTDMVKPGTVVTDVGINRDDAGRLCGDVDFADIKEVAGYITPVPGSVDPMTITVLLIDTLEATERAVEGAALAA